MAIWYRSHLYSNLSLSFGLHCTSQISLAGFLKKKLLHLGLFRVESLSHCSATRVHLNADETKSPRQSCNVCFGAIAVFSFA